MQGDSIRIVCTADEAKGTLYDGDVTGPLARVLGFEGSGVRPLTLERCDEPVRVSISGAVECLNVSVATGSGRRQSPFPIGSGSKMQA